MIAYVDYEPNMLQLCLENTYAFLIDVNSSPWILHIKTTDEARAGGYNANDPAFLFYPIMREFI